MAAPGLACVRSLYLTHCNSLLRTFTFRHVHSSAFRDVNKSKNLNKYLLSNLTFGSVGIFSIYVAVKLKHARTVHASVESLGNEQNKPCAKLDVSSKTSKSLSSAKANPWHFDNLPSKQIRHDKEKPVNLTLYQYVTCPFCCKVRAYLDYYGINYNIVEVDSIKRTQTKWTSYSKVPILVCDGVGPDGFLEMNDSSMIISLLQSQRLGNADADLNKLLSFYPVIVSKSGRKTVYEYPNKYFLMYQDGAVDREMAELREEREWRSWVDNNLVHVLSPNAYRTLSESFESFHWFSEAGDWEKSMTSFSRYTCIYLGALVMWAIGGRLKRRYGLEDDVRQSLYKSVNEWLEGVGPSRKFMGGDNPNLADLAVYGVMSAIEGCQAFKDLSDNTNFMEWYTPMKKAVQGSEGLSHVAPSR
ncbi:prostaglandin E synthase 2-like [Watersipora subatra]|uniref:prostaglandin E synthase 2-like n=1 Tax=Watersipora subatra TaxID=2589382 RepID=UPI00355B2097